MKKFSALNPDETEWQTAIDQIFFNFVINTDLLLENIPVKYLFDIAIKSDYDRYFIITDFLLKTDNLTTYQFSELLHILQSLGFLSEIYHFNKFKQMNEIETYDKQKSLTKNEIEIMIKNLKDRTDRLEKILTKI